MTDIYAAKLAALRARRAAAGLPGAPLVAAEGPASTGAPGLPPRPLPSRWPPRRRGEDIDTWAGRALASYAPEWEARQTEIERIEAERQADEADRYRRELRAERARWSGR